jgi:uncharacterized protein DUF1416
VSEGCGAPADGAGLAGVDTGTQAMVQGRVLHNGSALTTGYARLLNEGGDFVAEVPFGAGGEFRFFAAPGNWTVRVLAPGGVSVDRLVFADYGRVAELEIEI